MRTVIIGGGEIGLGISRRLAARHEIVVVDRDAMIADRFSTLDVRFLVGNGTSPEVLSEAGVASCDVLVAATGIDEVNVLASFIANRLGSPITICMVSREDLLRPLNERDLLREHFGIDRVVWPEAQLAEDIERIIAAPGAIDAETFEHGRIVLLEYRVTPQSPLAAGPLAALDLPRGVLVVAVRRGEGFQFRTAAPTSLPATRYSSWARATPSLGSSVASAGTIPTHDSSSPSSAAATLGFVSRRVSSSATTSMSASSSAIPRAASCWRPCYAAH